jgi:hypothetical protein
MNKLSIIINAFKNPETRPLAIGLGLADLTAIFVAIYAIVTGNIRLLAATFTIYVILYAIAKHAMKEYLRITGIMNMTEVRYGRGSDIEDEVEDELQDELIEDEDAN